MAEYLRTYEKPTAPPYPGWRWLFHRLTVANEYMMGFVTIPFGANEYVMMPEREAEWLKDHKGKAREHPARQNHPDAAVRESAIEYKLVMEDDPLFGVPLVLGENEEYLSRDGMPMYLQRGIDVKTTPRLIKVGEATGVAPLVQGEATAHPTADVVKLAGQMAQQMARQMMDEFLQEQAKQPARLSGRRPPRRRLRKGAPDAAVSVPSEP